MIIEVSGQITLSPYENVMVVPIKSREKAAKAIEETVEAKHPIICDVKQNRPRRANEASRYSWLLIDQIAAHDKLTSAEVYMQYLRDNPAEDVRGTTSTPVKFADIWERGCERYARGVLRLDHIYYERLGESNLPGHDKPFRHYRFYLGQSWFDTKQMWCFIREIETDAKAYGIEIMEDYKARKMMEEWDKAVKKREEGA
jgi:hypothetical protein